MFGSQEIGMSSVSFQVILKALLSEFVDSSHGIQPKHFSHFQPSETLIVFTCSTWTVSDPLRSIDGFSADSSTIQLPIRIQIAIPVSGTRRTVCVR